MVRRAVVACALVVLAAGCALTSDNDPAAGTGEGAAAAPADAGASLTFSAQIGNDGSTVVATASRSVVRVYAEPDESSARVVNLNNPVASGAPLVFTGVGPVPVPYPDWIEVNVPIRPNGTTGWVRTADVELSANYYRVDIDTSDYELVVSYRGEPVITTAVGLGNGATPTPQGSFFLKELLQPASPDGLYGPYAFGLSGFSNVLDSFGEGDAVIGIHGTNEPSSIGANASHGCIRVDNATMIELATTLPLGTPVKIRG